MMRRVYSGCESGRAEGLTVTMVCKIAERKKDAWDGRLLRRLG